MPNNSPTTKPEPKYRKTLNSDQLAVLELLYKFRFASSQQVASFAEKKSSKDVQKRLRILEEQGLIAKRYDKTYKLKGKPAAYYLLPIGARRLALLAPRKADEPINLKRIYKDKAVSENFIVHCLNVTSAYLQLRALHGDKLRFFTHSQVGFEKYEHFPQPLPDAYIRLKTSLGESHFFLEIYEDTQPYFVLLRRVKKYLAYADEGEWEAATYTDLPVVLMATETSSMQKRLRKRIAKEMSETYDEMSFATTTLPHLLNSEPAKGKVWTAIDEEGDDEDEPRRPQGLGALSQAPNRDDR